MSIADLGNFSFFAKSAITALLAFPSSGTAVTAIFVPVILHAQASSGSRDVSAPATAVDQSNELTEITVTAKTPQTFMAMANEDPVNSENCIFYYLALKQAKVPAEMHIFEHGPHGTALGQAYPALMIWPDILRNWLRENGWLAPQHENGWLDPREVIQK